MLLLLMMMLLMVFIVPGDLWTVKQLVGCTSNVMHWCLVSEATNIPLLEVASGCFTLEWSNEMNAKHFAKLVEMIDQVSLSRLGPFVLAKHKRPSSQIWIFHFFYQTVSCQHCSFMRQWQREGGEVIWGGVAKPHPNQSPWIFHVILQYGNQTLNINISFISMFHRLHPNFFGKCLVLYGLFLILGNI